jgi:hypothetical protein
MYAPLRASWTGQGREDRPSLVRTGLTTPPGAPFARSTSPLFWGAACGHYDQYERFKNCKSIGLPYMQAMRSGFGAPSHVVRPGSDRQI